MCECSWNTVYLTLDISQLFNILIFSIYPFWFLTRLSQGQVYFNYHLIINCYLTLNEHYSVTYIYTKDKFTNNKLSRWQTRWYWYGPKSASLDRLLIKVTWTVFQLHSSRKQISNNTSPGQLLHMSTCDLSIGVTAKCFLTSREPGSVTYSLDEPLIYVQSEGWVVYLIRPTQPGDSYFGSDFTHYIYWVLHTIFSFYYFRQCIFVKYEK